jgi:hypothetical protein
MSDREGKMAMAKSEEIRAKTATFDPSQAVGAIEPLLHAGNKWLENWMALSSEILEFSRTRLDRSLEVSKAMARSSTFDQAMDLQADYTRSAVRDYFSEASKLADLSARAMLDSLLTWQGAARAEASRGEAMTRRAAE